MEHDPKRQRFVDAIQTLVNNQSLPAYPSAARDVSAWMDFVGTTSLAAGRILMEFTRALS
jgi:hypothetical protein